MKTYKLMVQIMEYDDETDDVEECGEGFSIGEFDSEKEALAYVYLLTSLPDEVLDRYREVQP